MALEAMIVAMENDDEVFEALPTTTKRKKDGADIKKPDDRFQVI